VHWEPATVADLVAKMEIQAEEKVEVGGVEAEGLAEAVSMAAWEVGREETEEEVRIETQEVAETGKDKAEAACTSMLEVGVVMAVVCRVPPLQVEKARSVVVEKEANVDMCKTCKLRVRCEYLGVSEKT
jgi:hypothetical protein